MPELTGDPKQHPDSKFQDSLTGSCLCGSITVTIKDKELFSKPRGHLCHCSNCRKVAGSFVSSNLLIEADKVTIDDRDGTLKTYEDRATGSGNPVYRTFCSADGNPVKSETQAYPGKIVLKMGMMPRIPQPEYEGFGLHRHEWQGKHDGVTTFKTKWAGPDREKMDA
ncbi:hypothetical protein LTR91_023716 [Friedmanniomyces endolithicus]|uniref:CENP-V/GFA domain-containing protein n=1 Tax=Friedmanniomyces endolithicus TaxID=329885 RepID=A0AAN6H1R7_9PEZI|nr:hypothetical protein LTS09_006278 [Friedmanniomyces endolithicus]KAK0365563.1 hypothetical protein LTR94_006478 [Friedmanniomyces endolithicus]KAK0785166.1 hypothetical protein LTR59_011135 [Friedmanniomyces endolithicus]KAK0785769.1 hypothetical protein LTR38_012224 [Friedmanniomyces endolithicus]KAK0814569.1 hypothetical protein LTR75_004277 [Friedmanniomyces endolithicus]